jgi:hypothetical protein
MRATCFPARFDGQEFDFVGHLVVFFFTSHRSHVLGALSREMASFPVSRDGVTLGLADLVCLLLCTSRPIVALAAWRAERSACLEVGDMSDTRTSLDLLDRSIPVAPMPAIALHASVAERSLSSADAGLLVRIPRSYSAAIRVVNTNGLINSSVSNSLKGLVSCR